MTSGIDTKVEFDARPIIGAGGEPLQQIMDLVSSLKNGERLDILAPFEPLPLIELLRGKGFSSSSVNESDGSWRTSFIKVFISRDMTVREVLEKYPNLQPEIARAGLDTCCGANRPIGEASEAHGLEWTELHASLMNQAGLSPT